MTLIIIALIGVVSGHRLLMAIGAFGMAFMNGHDAVFMGLMGGSAASAGAGLVFALIAVFVAIVSLRQPGENQSG